MHDWLVYMLIGLACAASGLWLLRRRQAVQPARFAHQPTPAAERAAERVMAPQQIRTPPPTAMSGAPVPSIASETNSVVLPCEDAPNTKIMPFAEDMPVAVLDFEGKWGRFPLHRGEVVIGRHSEDDVRIADVRISRHHARLVVRGDGSSEIENLTATRPEPNPMLVNGISTERARIAYGDVVTLGGVSFRFAQAVA